MPQVTNKELFTSGLSFLNTYANSFTERNNKVETLKEELARLQPMVEKAAKITEEIKSIQKQNQSDEKFLMNMNDMILAETGEPISNGELFDAAKKKGEENVN